MSDQTTIKAADSRLIVQVAQAEQMAKEGLLLHGETTLTKAQVVEWLEGYPALGVCDFCSARPVVWSYPCPDISSLGGLPGHGSVGAWDACQGCADLIDAGDPHGLAERCAEHFGSDVPVWVFEGAQAEFHTNRSGPPTRIEGTDA